MKYQNKCIKCQRKATRKYRGRYFCDDCYKKVKRRRGSNSDRPDGVDVERGYKLTKHIYLLREFFVKFRK